MKNHCSKTSGRISKVAILVILLSLASLVLNAQNIDPAQSTTVVVLTIDGPIGPATRDYLINGIEHAEQQQAALVLIKMDTPGGLSASMRDMIKKILNAKVPEIGRASCRERVKSGGAHRA